MTAEAPSPVIATLDEPTAARLPDFVIDDGTWAGDIVAVQGIVLPAADEGRARHWLEAGARRVFLGEAALADGELVGRLAAEYGGDRIGVYVPATRMEVSWSLDTVSNADFSVVTPSVCEPAWEILRADGGRTGTFAGWWIRAMFERGAAEAILRVDIRDDADLNICAGLTEDLGDRLWFAPWDAADNDFMEWTTWGKVQRIAVEPADLDADPRLRLLAEPAVATPEQAAA